MSSEWIKDLEPLVSGSLLKLTTSESICFRAVLCDLRPRFIPKCRVGRGYRAVARNGRVLLASNMPMESLVDREAQIRLQLWRKVILPGEEPETYGLLICARCVDPAHPSEKRRGPKYLALLVNERLPSAELALDVGGGMALVFTNLKEPLTQ
jgi:hypothetical protein